MINETVANNNNNILLDSYLNSWKIVIKKRKKKKRKITFLCTENCYFTFNDHILAILYLSLL